jgi:hypothetical protein
MRLWAFRFGLPLALSLALGGSALAYMASNGVDVSSAGAGAGAITGYQISQIQYGLSAVDNDPATLVTVSFVVTPAPGGLPADQVAVWFNNDPSRVASSRLGTCVKIATVGAETVWNCELNSAWAPSLGPSATASVLDVAASH